MITIPTELYSSKNSRQIFKLKNGRTIIAKSNVAKQNEKDLCYLLSLYLNQWKFETANKKYPLRVHFKIYRKTKRRFDYVNIIQNLLDCMVMSGWLPDDDADNILPVFEQYEVCKNNPRVKISIENQ